MPLSEQFLIGQHDDLWYIWEMNSQTGRLDVICWASTAELVIMRAGIKATLTERENKE